MVSVCDDIWILVTELLTRPIKLEGVLLHSNVKFVKNFHPDHFSNKYVMMFNGYYLHTMALLSECK